MKISLHSIKIRQLVSGFEDNDEGGVVGYDGRLNIRPAFQREFVYSEKQEQEVISSVFKGFPLNVMYWAENADGTTYELLDGQQRTLSLCKFWAGEFFVTIGGALKGYDNLTPEERNRFLDYELQVYVCSEGTAQERLDWFRIINIAGERLTNQELLNAPYPGPWLTDAKRRFSKTGCVAYKLGERYMNGTPIRQDYLERVLRWISPGADVEKHMAQHQHDPNADREWQYFQQVIAWVQMLFPKYRKEMKSVEWGLLYNRHHTTEYSATALEAEVSRLMMDDDVTRKAGIYDYVLSGSERALSIRTFTESMKRETYERQQGICPHCKNHFALAEMEADHITPWHEGGRTIAENCQMLCRHCNRLKGGK